MSNDSGYEWVKVEGGRFNSPKESWYHLFFASDIKRFCFESFTVIIVTFIVQFFVPFFDRQHEDYFYGIIICFPALIVPLMSVTIIFLLCMEDNRQRTLFFTHTVFHHLRHRLTVCETRIDSSPTPDERVTDFANDVCDDIACSLRNVFKCKNLECFLQLVEEVKKNEYEYA